MTPLEYFTSSVAGITLFWNVVNEIRLREHSKALQANEAHLRVASELKLRLHQEAWSLLKETHEAAFAAYDSIRSYALVAIAHERTPNAATPLWGEQYQKTLTAVQRFSALAHVSPPARQELRDAASAFSKAFNMVNESLLGGLKPEDQQVPVMKKATEALAQAGLGTKDWNEELWQHQTVTALTKSEK